MAIPVRDSVRKMALISEQLYNTLQSNAQKDRLTETPAFSKMRSLDSEIKNILEDPKLSTSQKLERYTTALKEFMLFSKVAPEVHGTVEPALLTQVQELQAAAQQQMPPPPPPPPQVPAAQVPPQVPAAQVPAAEPDEDAAAAAAVPPPQPPPKQPLAPEAAAAPPATTEFRTPPQDQKAATPKRESPWTAIAKNIFQAPKLKVKSDQLTDKDIIGALSQERKVYAQNLLNIINKYPGRIGYNSTTGEMELDGKAVPNSKFMNILQFVTGKKVAQEQPAGVGRFLSMLQTLKEPLDQAIPNKTIRAAAAPGVPLQEGSGRHRKRKAMIPMRVLRWVPY